MIKQPTLSKAREDLAKARDEARRTIQLISSEARQKWKGFELKVGRIELSLNQRGEASAAKVHEIAHTVRQFVQRQLGKPEASQATQKS